MTHRRLPPALAATALCLLTLSLPAPSAAHTAGSAPLLASGNFTLDPEGQNNSTLHQFLAVMGLPTSPGDTLQMNWSINNGTGPPIVFEIHTHAGLTGYTLYYNKTASQLDDTWKVPDNSSFMVYFANTWNFSLYLTYHFVLLPPSPDFGLFVFLLPAGAGVALGWFFFVRAGRGGGSLDEDESADEDGGAAAVPAEANGPADEPAPSKGPQAP